MTQFKRQPDGTVRVVAQDSSERSYNRTSIPIYTDSVFEEIATNSSTFTLLPDIPCDVVQVEGDPIDNLYVQKNGAGAAIVIAPGMSRYFSGIYNANQLGIKSENGVDVIVEIIKG